MVENWLYEFWRQKSTIHFHRFWRKNSDISKIGVTKWRNVSFGAKIQIEFLEEKTQFMQFIQL